MAGPWDCSRDREATSVRSSTRAMTAPSSPASKPAPPPDVRVLRVAQVDAGRLDDELVSLLREQFARVFARVSPGAVTRRRSELTLLLDALVFYFTVWSHRPTPGMELMNLRYRDERPATSPSNSPSSSSPSPSTRTGMEGEQLSVTQRLLYGAAFVGGRFAWSKLRRRISVERWADEPAGTWRRAASVFSTRAEAAYSALALLNLLAFLNRGRYRTLTERTLHTRLVYGEPHAQRMVSYEYLNRQLVWRELSELALFVLPLVSGPSLRRAASRAFGMAGVGTAVRGGGVADEGAEGAEGVAEGGADVQLCAECGGEPAGARYAAVPCGHHFCYYCVAARREADRGYTCPRCREPVSGVRQVRADARGR